MKKIKLLVVTLISILILPISINAATKEPIKVHIFKGDGCGYCAAALEFFESIEDEYGKYFDLVEHEVWYDEDNATLMTEVASYFEEEVNGVPYIIIGDKTFQGYTESYNEQIKSEIKSQYESDNFEDIVSKIESENSKSSTKKENDNKTTIIIIAVALIGFVALFYFARDTKEDNEVIEEKLEEKSEEIEKEEKKTSAKKVNAPKATTKKTTNSKTTGTKKTTSANSKKSSTKSKPATKNSTIKKNK